MPCHEKQRRLFSGILPRGEAVAEQVGSDYAEALPEGIDDAHEHVRAEAKAMQQEKRLPVACVQVPGTNSVDFDKGCLHRQCYLKDEP